MELQAASEQAHCGLEICRTCSPGSSRGWTVFRRAPGPGAAVLQGIIFQQHLSGFFQPISHSPCCSFHFLGAPVQQAGCLVGCWGVGGALEGALHCGGAVRASGHRACWVEWEVGSRCHWCHLEMLVQLPCARCRSREPVLRQGCHSTCSTGPTFLQPKSRCLPVQPLAWGQVGWAGAACSSLRGCASWWILDGKLGMAEFGRVKEGEGRPNPALDSARLLCTSLLSCK